MTTPYTQLINDATALGKIGGTFNITATNVLAANAATAGGKAHVTSVLVVDTGANVATNIGALQTLGTKLTSIALTDGTTPTLAITALSPRVALG